MNIATPALQEKVTKTATGFRISIASKPEHADLCAANLNGTVDFLRQSPLVRSIQLIETKGNCLHRFSVSADAPQLFEATPDVPQSLARELEARAGGQFVSFDFDAIPAAQDRVIALRAFWKRWALSMMAVYPTLIVLFYLLRSVTADLPIPASLFLVAFILTGLNTRYILPFLSRRLQGWLTR